MTLGQPWTFVMVTRNYDPEQKLLLVANITYYFISGSNTFQLCKMPTHSVGCRNNASPSKLHSLTNFGGLLFGLVCFYMTCNLSLYSFSSTIEFMV